MSVKALRTLERCAVLVAMAACSPSRQPGSATPEPDVSSSANAATVRNDERVPADNVEKMLEGRVAGVNVTQNADGSISIRIRGGSTVHGNAEPLFIVDGLPVQAGPNGALSGINPRDIASIRVLKDAADVAMYGSRGANGVVIIKTKRPGR